MIDEGVILWVVLVVGMVRIVVLPFEIVWNAWQSRPAKKRSR